MLIKTMKVKFMDCPVNLKTQTRHRLGKYGNNIQNTNSRKVKI